MSNTAVVTLQVQQDCFVLSPVLQVADLEMLQKVELWLLITCCWHLQHKWKYSLQSFNLPCNNVAGQVETGCCPCYFTFTGFVQVLENLESPGILLWHFPGLESPGKKPLVLETPGNLLNSTKNMKCMEGSNENQLWDLGSVGVNVNFRALEKSICVLEESWKSPGNWFLKKGTNPAFSCSCCLRSAL